MDLRIFLRRRMKWDSFLKRTYHFQKNSGVRQQVKKKKKKRIWHDDYVFFLLWMLIGMLAGGVALAVVVTLYVIQLSKYSTFLYSKEIVISGVKIVIM
jgi:hypothetical protein